MRFQNEDDSRKWFASCQLKCKIDVEKISKTEVFCTANFVDCDLNGGYDPRDPCNQKCVTPLGGRNETTSGDTLQDEVTDETTSIIYMGEKIEVKCKTNTETEKVDCKNIDLGEIKFNDDPAARDKALFKKARKDGEPWEYECNWWQMALFDNCFNAASSAVKIFSGMISLSALYLIS